ncbi:hypothetical protein IHQ68_03435 [Chelatococcus sambhunathii]|uniref:DUF4935 domain-containing protein n=1 Tax=Chelatococcus sambhunathii TaxID=363953 RepID=A0ABU1DCN0_9HYPH|nr:hypothetical protein [Chelatococcus sambhunathii]MDR4305675.1 hypothetical protein [Chelatococcus sambhunathii]
MIVVVDSNFLQNPMLETYFNESATNKVVIIDYAAMEAFKGDTLTSVVKSTAILRRFPRQVLIAHGTKTVGRLTGTREEIAKAMINDEGTAEFREFSAHLDRYERGVRPDGVERQLLDTGRWATDHLNAAQAENANLLDVFKELTDGIFTKEEISKIRRGEQEEGWVAKGFGLVRDLASDLLSRHPDGSVKLDPKDYYNNFIFRMSLCVFVQLMDWIRVGSPSALKPARLLNDRVDAMFATYGTYFDDVLSLDKQMLRTFWETDAILRFVYAREHEK